MEIRGTVAAGPVTPITPSDDATLTGLKVHDGSSNLTLTPPFASSTLAYSASVGNAVDEVTVTVTKNHARAAITFFDGDDNVLVDEDALAGGFQVASVAVGPNTIKVKVTAEDGTTTRTYTVTVTQQTTVPTDVTAPFVESPGVSNSGTEVVLPFGEALNWAEGSEDSVAAAFTLLVEGDEREIDTLEWRTELQVAGGALVLTPASVIYKGQSVVVSYDKSTADRFAIVDLANNELESFTTGSGGVDAVANFSTAPSVGAPANFTAGVADARVTLSWDAPASDSGITRHDYRFKTTGGYPVTWTQIPNSGVGGANEDGHTVPGLTKMVAHTFQLRAVKDGGFGTAAESGPVTPPPGICDRTAKVQAVILAGVEGVSECAAVTVANLARVTELRLENESITALQVGDFAGLTAVTSISLNGNQLGALPANLFSGLVSLDELNLGTNQLTSLPDGVFSGLTALTTLALSDNNLASLPDGVLSGLTALTTLSLDNNPDTGDTLPLTVTVEKVGSDQARAKVLAGAPFAVDFTATVANGSLAGGATTLRVATGSVEGTPVTVERTAGIMEAVTVDIDLTTQPTLPAVGHSGYEFKKAPSGLPATILPAVTNNAPVFSATSTMRTVAENSPAGANVGAVIPEATDADSGDTLTYSMEGTDAASFDFDASTRRITTITGVDYNYEATKNSYSVTVKADDGNGSTDTIAVTIDVTDVNEKSAKPGKPTLAKVTGSTTSLAASWTKPGLNGGPDIAGYDVEYKVSTAFSWEGFAHSGTATTTTITGLMASTSYQVQVRAENGETDSDWSEPSDAVSTNAATPGTKPTLGIADAEGNEAAGVEFTVTLSAVAAADVTATWTASIGSGDTATTTDLTATTTDMVTVEAGDTTAKFTVPVEDDATDEDDETFTVTLSGVSTNAQLAADPTAEGTIKDNDAASRRVTLTLDPVEVQESDGGATVTVTAELDGAAREVETVVALEVTGGTAEAGTDFDDIADETVTIPPGSASSTVTFFLRVENDDIDEGDGETVSLGGSTEDLTVHAAELTIVDDDERGVTVSKTELTFLEGSKATYEVVLDTQPIGPVTVRVTVTETESPDVTAQPSRLWFTADDWDTAQTVTVRAPHDDDAAADTAKLRHAAAGADYRGETGDAVEVTVTDDDAPGVTVSEKAIEFREGGSATYTVMLDTQPSGPVTVTPSAGGAEDVTISSSSLRFTRSVRGVAGVTFMPPQLTFTPSDWNQSQTVTVRADVDLAAVMVEHEVAGAEGSGYESVTADSVNVTVTDAEAASTKVTLAVSPRTVREDAGETSLTVTAELDGAAATTATVLRLSATSTQADFEAVYDVTLTIPAGDWRVTAPMTLAPVDDDIDGSAETKTVTVSGTTTASLRVVSAEVTIVDDDTRALVVLVSPRTVPPTVRIGRNGEAEYTVRLATQPEGGEDVMVSADLSAPPGVTVAPEEPLRFTAANWSDPQTVTVTVAPGTAYRDGETAAVVYTVSGADYGSVAGGEVVVLLDPDAKLPLPREPGERLAPTAQEATQEWIARFGRTVTAQVLEAIEARLRAPRAAGMRATLAGQALPAGDAGVGANDNASDRVPQADARDREAMATIGDLVAHAGAGPGSEAGADDWRVERTGGRYRSRTVTGRELLTGTSFALTGGSAESGGFAGVWGRGTLSRFEGRAGDLSLDGEVATGLVGVDWAEGPGSGAGRWMAGLAVGHSRGAGGYRKDGCTDESCAGDVEATLTSVLPYAGLALTDRLSVWAAAGHGAGELRLMPGGNGGPFTADLTMTMGAAGLRGEVLTPPPEGGLTLAVKGDTRFTRTQSKAAKDADGGLLKAASATVSLVRAGVEGSRRLALADDAAGMVLTPSFEVGARLDGGDAETGLGMDLGGGLAFAAPKQGVALDLKARGLIAHEAPGFREWGASASLTWDPRPETGRGLALSLVRSWGGSPSGGMAALLGSETPAGTGADDDAGATSAGRLEAELGYGLPAFGGGFTGTPNLGIGLSDTARDYRLGWRLTPARNGAPGFEIGLDATRREAANTDAVHGLMLRGTIRW